MPGRCPGTDFGSSPAVLSEESSFRCAVLFPLQPVLLVPEALLQSGGGSWSEKGPVPNSVYARRGPQVACERCIYISKDTLQ